MDPAFDLTDALTGPILTFSASWSDCIPKRMKDLIPIARMKALMLGEQWATDPEIVCYLITRTFEAPMDHDWVDIYTHISCKVCEEYFKEDHWEQVKAPRELSQWLQGQLNDLRRHLYNKRRELLKKKLKTQKAA